MLDPADRLAIRRWTLRCWVTLACASLPAAWLAAWTASPALGALGKGLFLVYGLPVMVVLPVQAIRFLLGSVNGGPVSR